MPHLRYGWVGWQNSHVTLNNLSFHLPTSIANFTSVSINSHPTHLKMPKATSTTFTRAHGPVSASKRPSANAKEGASASAAASGGARNHLFNTERFGQHILTNPLVAQG